MDFTIWDRIETDVTRSTVGAYVDFLYKTHGLKVQGTSISVETSFISTRQRFCLDILHRGKLLYSETMLPGVLEDVRDMEFLQLLVQHHVPIPRTGWVSLDITAELRSVYLFFSLLFLLFFFFLPDHHSP